MLRLWDFECQNHVTCNHTFEEMVKYEDASSVLCPRCNGPTTRLIGTPMIDPKLGLDAASYPTMGDKWARIRRQRQKIESSRTYD